MGNIFDWVFGGSGSDDPYRRVVSKTERKRLEQESRGMEYDTRKTKMRIAKKKAKVAKK